MERAIMSDVDGRPPTSSPALGGAKRSHISGQEPELSGARPRILVLDDMIGNLDLYAALLELRGWHFTGVQHGNHALQELQAAHWDLFITDLMHPGVDTIVLCRFIRSQPALAALPILVITADERGCEEMNEFYGVRAVCLGKPVEIAYLMQIVTEALNASRRGMLYPSEPPTER